MRRWCTGYSNIGTEALVHQVPVPSFQATARGASGLEQGCIVCTMKFWVKEQAPTGATCGNPCSTFSSYSHSLCRRDPVHWLPSSYSLLMADRSSAGAFGAQSLV